MKVVDVDDNNYRGNNYKDDYFVLCRSEMEQFERAHSLGDLSTTDLCAEEKPDGPRRLQYSSLDVRRANDTTPPDASSSLLDDDSPEGPDSPIHGTAPQLEPSILDDDSSSDDESVCKNEECVVVSTEDVMDTEEAPPAAAAGNSPANLCYINPLYQQCKIARLSGHNDRLVSVSTDSHVGASIVRQSVPVGSLTDHPGIENSFFGSRIQSGNVTMNQTVSMSFDPSNLVCITCGVEHKIMEGKPITVFFSDQNFVSSIEGPSKTCLCIVRVEDASLTELFAMSKELFELTNVPEGSIFLYGSASFLSRVGTSMYASDWIELVSCTEKNWRGIRVGPLIPIIVADCPGTLAREIAELAAWLSTVYDSNPLGLHVPWARIVSATEDLSVGGTVLLSMDTYKVPLPANLALPSIFQSTIFCSTSSRPVTLRGLPKDTVSDLLRCLITTIHSDFKTCDLPENFLARPPLMARPEALEQKIVLVGASNLSHCAKYLELAGHKVDNLCIPGWIASPDNIAKMSETIKQANFGDSCTYIFDLYSNSSYRFEQFDGSLSLPIKVGKKYHLPGDIKTCPLDAFKKIVESTLPLIKIKKNSVALIVPPSHATYLQVIAGNVDTVQTLMPLIMPTTSFLVSSARETI